MTVVIYTGYFGENNTIEFQHLIIEHSIVLCDIVLSETFDDDNILFTLNNLTSSLVNAAIVHGIAILVRCLVGFVV